MDDAVGLSKAIEAHEQVDNERFRSIHETLALQMKTTEQIHGEIRFLRDNHIGHMESDIASIMKALSSISKDLSWMRWLLIPIGLPVVDAFVKVLHKYL